MKEVNVLSLFGAVEKAQAAANKTGKSYSVRLSDYVEKPRYKWAIVPYMTDGETPEDRYYWYYMNSRAEAVELAKKLIMRDDRVIMYDIVEYNDATGEVVTPREYVQSIRRL